MTIVTYVSNTHRQNGMVALTVAAGTVQMGDHIDMTSAEIEKARLAGAVLAVGTASTNSAAVQAAAPSFAFTRKMK